MRHLAKEVAQAAEKWQSLEYKGLTYLKQKELKQGANRISNLELKTALPGGSAKKSLHAAGVQV
jgi:hypothetical protein